MREFASALLAVLLPCVGPSAWAASSQSGPATGTQGMVSSGHTLATDAGLDVLRAGGNAFDAAVAIAATLSVVEPMMSGPGGYGTIMVFDASRGEAWFLNSSGRIPQTLNSDVFRAPTPDYEANRRGAKAVSTPGNVKAWEAMWKRFGTKPWASLFATAQRHAAEGFAISARSASLIEDAYGEFAPNARAIYGRNGVPLDAGDRLVQRDLARSLRLIAEQGASALHGGALGRVIDSTMRSAGSFLTLDDLAKNEAEWWKPIEIRYRGVRVVSASPPANTFDALVRLGLMSRLDVKALGHNSAAYLHRFAEVTKHGFWVRLRWAGDPDVAPPPLDNLLSERYWDSVMTRLDTLRATPFVPPRAASALEGRHTTHFVVADRWGNVVSATQTLGNSFGSRIMPEGTGIWLNNSLAYSTFEPKGNAMDAFPGRHKLSGDVPLFVMREGRPWIAIGTPGGHTIGQTVPQIVMNLVDFGMDIQAGIAAPRISFVEPDAIAVEENIPVSVRESLSRSGHRLTVRRAIGDAHGLTIEYGRDGKPARFAGGSDPRGEGAARGY